ncbi:MAG TPA: TIGR03619 family F420-dependent LLM class oxidoreductase [Solirubrobacterales bacterium]|nr:TIGR03619 family F420-dependent LLM class oxidoreductase [Solirubrobacterales bacterium]
MSRAQLQPRLQVGLDNFGDFLPRERWRELLDIAAAADEAGVDSISVVDHVVLGGDLGAYPYGPFVGGSDGPWLEPLTTLAAIAGRTSRVRLATGILIAPLRPPALLAKTAATLDLLSAGRLDLGVGTGWQAKEYEAVGLDFGERGRLLDDGLAACQALWGGGPAAFSSPRLGFDDVYCHPTPVQEGGVPFWIGGELHPRNLARLVRFGRGWIPSPTARRRKIGADIECLDAALVEAGRAPREVRVRVGLPVARDEQGRPLLEPSLAKLPALRELGATDIYVSLTQLCPDPAEAPRFFDALVAGFRENLN